jgi:gamma-glutamyltranspeptidase / glutathione hydrolase
MVGRDVILAGGNAADAAAAMGLTLAVTLPSRAGLGGGGACMVHDTARARSEVVEFISAGSVPMLARGLAALQARYGSRAWSNAVAPAETLARFGFTVSKTLAEDLAVHGGALLADPAALSAFMDRRRQFASAGSEIRVPLLADTLSALRTQGAAASSPVVPEWKAAVKQDDAGYVVISRAIQNETAAAHATATTGFVVGDKNGLAVACVLSMGAMFGTGHMASMEGYLLSATLAPDTIKPVVVTDATFGQPVLMLAVAGPSAADLTRVVIQDWLKDAKNYDDVRTRVQTLSNQDLRSTISAAVCETGLGIVGQDCRTFSDPRGFGLGLTFGPEDGRVDGRGERR